MLYEILMQSKKKKYTEYFQVTNFFNLNFINSYWYCLQQQQQKKSTVWYTLTNICRIENSVTL